MQSKTKFLTTTLLLGVCLSLFLASCQSPAVPDPTAAQIDAGAPIYARDCATEDCHGINGDGFPSEITEDSGDGYRVWPLLGSEFEARNPNAQVIFDVVRSGGEANLRALSDEEIYAAIAYELAQNGVVLSEPLNDANAAGVRSGANSPAAAWGSLFPPPGNARLLDAPPSPPAAPQATNGEITLRVGQLALASVIGKSVAPENGYFVILVFAIQNEGKTDLAIDPQYLSLVGANGYAHASAPANLAFPMERFHPLTILPGCGLAGYEIFAIPPGAGYDRLVYHPPGGSALEIRLR